MVKTSNRKHLLKRGGIAERWIYVTFLPSLIAILIAVIFINTTTTQNYYFSAEQAINFRINITMDSLPTSGLTPAGRYSSLVDIVRSFPEKDMLEVMLLDSDGNVLVTSSGFSYSLSDKETDFLNSFSSENKRARYIGKGSNGERIIAVTQLLDGGFGDAAAIRMVSSLSGIDEKLASVLRLTISVAALLILMIITTGSLFVRSLILPLTEVGTAADQIASGDFDAKIDNVYTGEIGELCETINDMAAELDSSTKLKNDFISSISHEIRTPLTSIKGWGETLSDLSPEETEIRKLGLDIIISETDRLRSLVEDLLDFSRLESDRALKLNCAHLDLCSELATSVLTLTQRAKQMSVNVEYTPCEGPVPVFADTNKLKQIFSNIFDNAVKYSPRRGTIYVSLIKDDLNAVVSIKDQGPGIPPDELSKVTERYYRASNSVYGTGIGLALVNEIANAHGGSLKLESTLGEGTTVIIRLPLDTSVTEASEKKEG